LDFLRGHIGNVRMEYLEVVYQIRDPEEEEAEDTVSIMQLKMVDLFHFEYQTLQSSSKDRYLPKCKSICLSDLTVDEKKESTNRGTNK
jgi:hypothetical protein